MANATGWLGAGTSLSAAARAADALRRIQEKPCSIVIVRGKPKASLTAQTVRVEYDDGTSNNEAEGAAGLSSVQRVTVFGIRGHASETDTDIARDDQFLFDGLKFRVISIVWQTGEVQAKCEAMG